MLGVSLGSLAGEHVGESSLIESAQLDLFTDDSGDITRLTVFLAQAATPTVEVQGASILLNLEVGSSTGGLFAALEETPAVSTDDDSRVLDASRGVAEGPGTPSGPQAIDGLSLSSMDYVDEAGIARVVIGSTTGIDYVSSQPDPNLVVVDFPGASVPQSLKDPWMQAVLFHLYDSFEPLKRSRVHGWRSTCVRAPLVHQDECGRPGVRGLFLVGRHASSSSACGSKLLRSSAEFSGGAGSRGSVRSVC